ncbi:MAG: hypothetical protein RIQ59_401 [Bacteroidota bacterium]|jgi:hypothetical protein
MKKLIFLIKLLLVCIFAKAQNIDSLIQKTNNEVSFDFGSFYTSMLNKNFYGANIDFKYYVYKRFATGFSYSMTQHKVEETFNFSIGQPIINYYEFGWINQYDILQNKKFRIGLNLSNGLVISRLGDNDNLERYYVKGWHYRPIEVATNYFYLLQPGLDISFKLFSSKHYPDFYLTTKAKYRFVFGDSKYGQVNDFSNSYFGIGFSIIGFTNEDSNQKSK